MHYIWTVLQLLIVGLIIYFVSGRLIGTKLNFMKRILSAVFSLTFTTFVYWYSYLRHTDYKNEDMVQAVTNVSTLVWIGSMLLIAMLFYLILELFDPIQLGAKGERLTGQKNIVTRFRSRFHRQKRLVEVFRIAFKHGIGKALKYKRTYENDRYLSIALRNMLEECGGIFIKFGQVLSARKDIFPAVFIEELSTLQQNVKPMTAEQVEKRLEQDLSKPMSEVFRSFNMQPIASGSIGQVHKAILRENGKEVVVKLLRPNITSVMQKDLDILLHFSSWLVEESTWAENLGFHQLATGFANSLLEEINFEMEVRNMEQVSNALSKSKNKVKIPYVYKKYSNEYLLVLEYIHGVSIYNYQQGFEKTNEKSQELLSSIYDSFLEQLLIAGVFHADPHPGNLYVMNNGKAAFLDFGAVGRLGPVQQKGLRTLFIGIERNDPEIVLEGLKNLLVDTNGMDEEGLLQALSQLLIQLQYLDKVSTEELVQTLFTIIQHYELKLYPMVGVALRALITLEGTLNGVDPTFDLFSEAKRFTAKNKRSFVTISSPTELKDHLQQELIMMLPMLKQMPKKIDHITTRLEKGEMKVKLDMFSGKENTLFISQWFSLFILLMVGITFGIISVALLAISQFINTAYAVYLNTVSFLGLFLSAVLLVRLSVQAIRNSKRAL
ncbi:MULTISPECIES: ABC1 kinase family protein [unclassified Viridibacillus]|uniref:ABC1 kinase family protein n=1 Tax=unclassified Viridibacillus TaxID=2617942 RepID=UPI00096D8112|nr:AarF/UbiB family protein [Viridibacillus sp. FSL H7-0596]OMC87394.1 ubiquinone biosynthesis protein [Viridibacillus sp. FSL H7-0596]